MRDLITSSQVLVPYIKISIGSKNITPIPPQHLLGFSYIRETNDVANKFDITVFDDTAMELEGVLSKGFDKVTFSYGWSNTGNDNRWISPEYGGMILDYKLTLDAGGATLDINGITNIVKSHVSTKPVAYGSEEKPLKIHEIVEDIAKFEGWEIGYIEPTSPVLESKESEKFFTRDNISPIKFIKNELLQKAKSAKSGKSGYVLWFEDGNDVPKISFSPIEYTEPESEYIYKINAENSNTISFSADFNGTLYMLSGNGKVKAEFIEEITNEMAKVEGTEEDDEGQITAEEKKSDTSSSEQIPNISSGGVDEMQDLVKFYRDKTNSESYGASLEILGDPKLKVFQTITVIVITRYGRVHHTSGLYMIREIRESIDIGKFTTSLELTRDTSREGELDAIGIKIGSVYRGL